MALEAKALDRVLPQLIGQHSLLVGSSLQEELMRSCPMFHRQDRDYLLQGYGEADALKKEIPVRDQSLDLMVLPHTLEYCYDMTTVLADASRLLQPAGYIIVMGFNPYHPWVYWQAHHGQQRCRMPWGGRLHSVYQMKHQLQKRGFELLSVQSLQRESSSFFMLRLFGSEVFMILARKKTRAVKPQRFYWRLLQALRPSTVPDITRTIHHDSP